MTDTDMTAAQLAKTNKEIDYWLDKHGVYNHEDSPLPRLIKAIQSNAAKKLTFCNICHKQLVARSAIICDYDETDYAAEKATLKTQLSTLRKCIIKHFEIEKECELAEKRAEKDYSDYPTPEPVIQEWYNATELLDYINDKSGLREALEDITQAAEAHDKAKREEVIKECLAVVDKLIIPKFSLDQSFADVAKEVGLSEAKRAIQALINKEPK